MPNVNTKPKQDCKAGLEKDLSGFSLERATEVGSGLRHALRAVLAGLSSRPSRPQQLARTLSVDKSLPSRLLAALEDPSELGVIYRMPGPLPLRQALAGAAKCNVPAAVLDDAAAAVAALDSLIEQVGSQGTLNALLGDYLPDVRSKIEVRGRQSAFKGMSQVLGCACDLAICTQIIFARSSEGAYDAADFIYRSGMRKLRLGPPFLFRAWRDETANQTPACQRGFTDFEGKALGSPGSSPVLREFSSPSLPGLDLQAKGPRLVYILRDEEIRLCTPIDLAVGMIMPGSYCREGASGRKTDYQDTIVQVPTKLQVACTLIADDVWPGIHPELHLYRACPMEPDEELEDRWYDRLGSLETLEYLGRGLDNAHLPECRDYLSMLTRVFEKLRLDPTRFRGYRVRMRYPMYNLHIVKTFDLSSGSR